MKSDTPYEFTHYHFEHVVPGEESWSHFSKGDSDEGLLNVAFDAFSIAEGAAHFFRGFFPQDLPYFPNESYLLPWHKKHWTADPDGVSWRQVPIALEVDHFVGEGLEIAKSQDADGQLSAVAYFASGHFEKDALPEAEVKVFAALSMMSSDQVVKALVQGDYLEAMTWLSQAYKSLIDCTAAAERILGFASDKARLSAMARHSENHSMKSDVFAWLDEHMNDYSSMDGAAQAIVEKRLVPVTFRTVRQWVTDWKKRRPKSGS